MVVNRFLNKLSRLVRIFIVEWRNFYAFPIFILQTCKMLRIQPPSRRRAYGKLLLLFVIVVILSLSHKIYVSLVTDHSNSDGFYLHHLGDLIWSNESVPLISPRDACHLGPNILNPEILVMVPSATENFERRLAIRNSWGDTPLVRSGKIKVVFVLGQNLNGPAATQV